jgi:hypothetical protein
MFIAGLILFSAASFGGGVARSEGWPLAARTIQGIDAALVARGSVGHHDAV